MKDLKLFALVPAVLLLLFFLASNNLQAQDYNHLSDAELKEMLYQEIKTIAALDGSVQRQLYDYLDRTNISDQVVKSREEFYRFNLLLKIMVEESIEMAIVKESDTTSLSLVNKTYDEYVKWKKIDIEEKEKSRLIVTNQYELSKEILEQETIPFIEVAQVPQFENCPLADRDCFQSELQNHIRKNFIYPEEAIANQITGKVYCSFIIQNNGLIVIKAIRAPDPILENAVQEIMMKLPKLKPAVHEGRPVAMSMSIPISFKLAN